MRTLTFCAALLFLGSCAAPRKHANLQGELDFSAVQGWRPHYVGAAMMAVSGACYGVHETVVHHPDRIPANWNQQWWDARISWTNKGNTTWGKTFGSFGTDAKHTFGPVHRWTMYSAAVVITIGRRRPVAHYLLDAGLSFAAFSIGFHGIYSLAFR